MNRVGALTGKAVGMKRLMIVVAIAALAAVMVGCSQAGSQSSASSSQASQSESSASPSEASSEPASPSSQAVPTTGGWAANTDFDRSALTKEQIAVFEQANEAQVDSDLEPIAVLGEQVVAGMNYAYLCRDAGTGASEPVFLSIAGVYEDLEGASTIVSVASFDVDDIATLDTSSGQQEDGAWEIVDAPEKTSLPDDVASAFTQAMDNYDSLDAKPVALLASQVVAGMNYKILCIGKPNEPNAPNGLYVATIYKDLSGGAEVTDLQQVDLMSYVGM